LPVEPVGAVVAAYTVVDNVRRGRTTRKGNASNVVLITELKPRTLDGYELVCDVLNFSPFGISNVAVGIRMLLGELTHEDKVETHHTAFATQAIPTGHTLSMRFPHIVRLGRATFDTEKDRGAGYTATLYWRNERGKHWLRTDGERAKPCKSRDFPSRPASAQR
jgi:hypothetical protein